MGKLFVLVLITIIFAVLWSLPIYLVGNLLLWAFHVSFRLTLLQAFTVTMIMRIIHSLLFKNERSK